MRNLSLLFLLVLLSMLSCQSSNTSKTSNQAKSNSFYKPFSEFKGDTLQYLSYNFVGHKEQYNRKKLNALIDDLEIPVKSFRHSYRFSENGISSSLTLLLSGTGTKKRSKHQPALSSYSLTVRWEKPLSKSELVGKYKPSEMEWNANWDNDRDSLEAFLGKQTITNVGVCDHSSKDSVKFNPFYQPLAEFKGDTVQYLLYNFKNYGEQYEGQPFEALYRDLEMPVKSFGYSLTERKNLIPDLVLYFYGKDYTLTDGHHYAKLHVSWQMPIREDELLKWTKASHQNSNVNLAPFFSKQILAEVYVTEYRIFTTRVATDKEN